MLMKKEKSQYRNSRPYRIHTPSLRKSLLRNNAPAAVSGGPTTPHFKWKLEDAGLLSGSTCESDKVGNGKERNDVLSARKLAANIWLVNGSFGIDQPNIIEPARSIHHARTENNSRPQILTNHLRKGTGQKLYDSVESSTKWNPQFQIRSKFPEDQQLTPNFDTSTLRSELEHAHARITELETERHSAKKKLDSLIRKLSDEKESWRAKEHEKIQTIIDSIKEDLRRERKTRHKIEMVNSKLVNELTEAKLSAKRFLQDYEKEKKSRVVMEEVCDELAKEIGEDKSEVEELKANSIRIREEVEEERKLLQMAEVWREERVQMKLVDAKITLEEKYSELSKLQAQIEMFLTERRGSNGYNEVNKEAKLLKKEVESVKVKEVKKFTYEPPPSSEDIYSVFEEIKPNEEANGNERGIEACYGYRNASANDTSSNKPKKEAAGIEDGENGCVTVSHLEEQGSSNSVDGGESSVNNIYEESNASVSGADWEINGEYEKENSETSEACSVGTKQSRKKGSSIARFWKHSHRNSFEVTNGRMHNATLSPDGTLGGTNQSSPSVKNWSSPESVKQIINRGVKGIIDHWPRGMQKQNMKAKHLEARVDIQKLQLRHALEQTI